jgi:hypothetical protein
MACWTPHRKGFHQLHSTQQQVQSLHWAIQDAAERRELLFSYKLDFKNAFNSVDYEALWQWLKEQNVPDIDLLQSLYSGAYYQADLPYGRSAQVVLTGFDYKEHASLSPQRAFRTKGRPSQACQPTRPLPTRACGRVWSRDSHPHCLLPMRKKSCADCAWRPA